jgi:NAD-dependent dihydropyrimidine dehydrogenase PreA subunit
MARNWYPVINYELCDECGACTDKCMYGVYNKEKAPRPVVVYPEGCIDGCHGCADLCPAGAIEYFGDRSLSYDCGCGVDSCEEGCGGGCSCGCEDREDGNE